MRRIVEVVLASGINKEILPSGGGCQNILVIDYDSSVGIVTLRAI
jgi:hypothetical protein